MNLHIVKKILNAEVICGSEFLNRDVKMGCGCDLMSHVLAHIEHKDTLLLTGLTTPQVIYTTDVVDIKAICFVRGKRPDEEVIKLAETYNIVLLGTNLPLFESCGKLYKEGLTGISEYESSN
ncbi:MAG: DRTGG domain-containing protein [Bacteroidetes bacterium]|nr:DRTGG domain-containing protein [Bacteroidota bacterium]